MAIYKVAVPLPGAAVGGGSAASRRGLEVIVESLFIHQASANGRAVLLSLLADARLRTTLPNRGIEVASLRIFLQALILLTRSARSSITHARAQAYVRLTDERET